MPSSDITQDDTTKDHIKVAETLPADCDPDLRNMPSYNSTVDINDECVVNLKYLKQLMLEVVWSHDFARQKGAYYMLAFTNRTKADNPLGRLFIAMEKMDDFEKSLTTDSNQGTLIIKSTFQYGQANKAGKNRFLVLHNPDLSYIHQNRFVVAALQKWGTIATNAISQVGNEQISSLAGLFKILELIGQNLRTWSKAEEKKPAQEEKPEEKEKLAEGAS